MLKLKLQYFGHPVQTDDSLEKSLMVGKMEGRRKRASEDEMAGHPAITNAMSMNLGKFWEMVRDREACAAVHGVVKSWTQLGN